jgi:4-hydroxybenzoate polyprenyltransferase
MAGGWRGRLAVMLEMIKFQHTIFAMPFAIMSAALASTHLHGIPWRSYFWILVAMVSARSAAMAFNRLVDQDIDSLNPRTLSRALPRGLLTRGQVGWFTLISSVVFILAAYNLNTLAFALSPVALAVVLGYSFTKRVTWLSHPVLGLALGIAPVGAWVAVTGRIELPPILLSLAVLAWTAGFDIIYACQDVAFDVEHRIHSIPQRFGVARALQVSSLLHVFVVLCLAALASAASLGAIYLAGLVVVAVLLFYEHRLVRPDDLSRIDAAFFTTNGLVSIGLMVFLLLDLLI